jgi:hypothetical protein
LNSRSPPAFTHTSFFRESERAKAAQLGAKGYYIKKRPLPRFRNCYGTRNPSLVNIVKIANALSTPLAELCDAMHLIYANMSSRRPTI